MFLPLLLQGNEPTKENAFSNVNQTIATVHFEMRYASSNNFTGQPIDGYIHPICYLSNKASIALQHVQDQLLKEEKTLKVFDCYRPQRAVDHFVRWAKDIDDTKMKELYYPNVMKEDLFKDGYIAAKSGHSRGSTVDLSIEGLDMGTPFDFFDLRSHTMSKAVTKKQHQNRLYLKKVMEDNGFQNYSAEWWHYTLKEEPFKKHYFDFLVE